MDAELLNWLLESTLASSAAIVAVMVLRTPVQRAFGVGTAYALWLLVLAAWLATLLPAPVRDLAVVLAPIRIGAGASATRVDASTLHVGSLVLPVWLAGAAVVGGTCWKRQRDFMRRLGTLVLRADGLLQANAVHGLPAVIGLRSRIVVPADFDTRYRDDERALILTHERIHARRGDLVVQALLLALRAAYWFNPLVWLATERVRRDQELACDASVVACHPDSRRTYAEAMVKTSLGHVAAPLACHWTGIHPLKERIVMLKHTTPSRRTLLAGACAIVLMTTSAGFAAWALQTPQTRMKPAGAPLVPPVPGSTESGMKLLNGTINLHVNSMPLREVALKVEALSGVHILNPEVLSTTRPVTFDFRQIEASTVLRLLAEENGSALKVEGDSVRFVPRGADPLSVTNGTAPAQGVTRTPAPAYPAAAIAGKQSGKVVLLIDVNADGTVAKAEVETSDPPGMFDQATLDAAKQWTFIPVMENGKPVANRVRVPVDFDLDKPADATPGAADNGAQAVDGSRDANDGDFGWVRIDAKKNGIRSMTCDVLEGQLRDPGGLVACGNLSDNVVTNP